VLLNHPDMTCGCKGDRTGHRLQLDAGDAPPLPCVPAIEGARVCAGGTQVSRKECAEQWFLAGNFVPQGQRVSCGDILGGTTGRREGLLASGGQISTLLLNALPCLGQSR
jgi:hypothetical protein